MILLLLLAAFSINAQTKNNYENTQHFQSEEIKPNKNINIPFKSANEDIFVLDSSVQIRYRSTYNDTTRYYYKYNSKKNIIEETVYTTIKDAASGFTSTKYKYFYDENDSIIATIYYELVSDTKQWMPVLKTETNYHTDENRTESFYFLFDAISGEWILGNKMEVIYDDSGREISNTKYQLNTANEWYPKQKTERIYNEKGITLSITWYNWNESQNKLQYSRKQELEYGEDENHIKITIYKFDKNSGNLIGDERSEIVLENGKYAEYIASKWDQELNLWQYTFKLQWTYDTNGNETSYSSFDWDTNENIWKGENKSESSYNPEGLLEIVSNFVMDSTGQWIGTDRKEYLYNDAGNEISSISSVWDENTDDWVYSFKVEKEYNSNNKEIISIGYKWDVTINDWIFSSKVEKEYNSNNKEITSIGYEWDVTINDWVFSTKSEKEYNSSNQITLTATYNWDNDQKEWDITGKNLYEFDIYGHNTKASQYVVYRDEVLELKETNEYFYSQLTTNANTVSPEIQTIKVYPNPTNETFTIETQNPKTVFGKLYNLHGELIKVLQVRLGINTYNISDVKNGVYFIQIPEKEGLIVKKLVKN